MDISGSINEIVEGNFMPHGHCLLWRTDLLLMHVVSDVIITLAYFIIPFALVYFVHKRKDLAFNWIFVLFSTFIFACGATHVMSLINVWHGYYYTAGAVKMVTATASLLTAALIWPLIPKLLALPSPAQLKKKNEDLEEEIKRRNKMEYELRHLNAELWHSNALQRAIVDSTNYFILATDTQYQIVSANPAAEAVSGFSQSELVQSINLASLLDQQLPPASEGSPAVTSTDTGAAQTQANPDAPDTEEFQCHLLRKDGVRIPVSLSRSQLRDANGVVTGFVVIGADITERIRLERMKKEFVATVSHELRTPLTSISGSLALLSAGAVGQLPDKAQEMSAIAHRNALRLNTLVNDILDVEKLESGNLEFNYVPIEIESLVKEGIKADLPYAVNYGVTVRFHSNVDSEALVMVDSNRIAQVLTNLLSNAIKFSEAGGFVDVTIDRSQDNICLSVTDYGPGIRAEFHDQIFLPFTQSDSSDTRQGDGTGLGLCISKTIVEKHAGKITFSTVLGEGTTFNVYLPIYNKIAQTQPS